MAVKGRKLQRQRLALVAAALCAVLLSDRDRHTVTIDRRGLGLGAWGFKVRV